MNSCLAPFLSEACWIQRSDKHIARYYCMAGYENNIALCVAFFKARCERGFLMDMGMGQLWLKWGIFDLHGWNICGSNGWGRSLHLIS